MEQKISVLGTPLDCLDYQGAIEQCKKLQSRACSAAVSACNTHIVSAARHQPSFASVMQGFDMILPDGMPLIWCLNAKGAKLKDRVYGPYFMEAMLKETPAPYKHFFFGGTEQCLEQLEQRLLKKYPQLHIAGSFSPPFRSWTEEDNEVFIKKITDTNPDFIWVALGGEKQEKWTIDHLGKFPRGVFLAVGDAFALLAGQQKYAPHWMQKRGIHWLYRLLQDPRRLWKRYFKYNALFIFYLLHDRLCRPKK